MATPPGSFTDGSCFFNGSIGGFFGSTGQSPVAQPWNPQSSDPAIYNPNLSQHFNFVGEPSQFAPLKPPQSSQDFQLEEEFSNPNSSRDNTYVNVDSSDEAPGIEKRIFWTQEDVRMMSSWLLNSTDSTIGADRKNDQYWTDKAHVLCIKDNEKLNLGPFVLMEVWNTLKTKAKWITYKNGLKAARKRKGLGKEKEVEDSSPLDLKYAKSKEVDHIDLEELDKFGKIQCEEHANRLKVLEVQKKLAHLAAKDQKVAAEIQREARKYELETKMSDTYNCLVSGRFFEVR
ncbi:hypothetical protein PVAP13_2NG133503 [Panicum virgatum]|uniref:No apical meristem-associated C-terminal domain-containing protein n=1 Tax=Panicum virgatum TaxID=38727 RepID=A0A8T0VET0_PANVG|nr:hypothetical protein PVAP13_2NG133503 [Panicum virgatum]